MCIFCVFLLYDVCLAVVIQRFSTDPPWVNIGLLVHFEAFNPGGTRTLREPWIGTHGRAFRVHYCCEIIFVRRKKHVTKSFNYLALRDYVCT